MDVSRYKPPGAGKNHKLVPSKRLKLNGPSLASGNGKGKVRLLTRAALDGRTRPAKEFDGIVANIINDLGGDPSTIQLILAEAFAGSAVTVRDLNTRLKLGEKIDIAEQSQALTTLVRVASRLPSGRVARDITPLLSDIMREHEQQENTATSSTPVEAAPP
jgi:hypothetical protein